MLIHPELMLDDEGYDIPNSGAFAIEESDYLKRLQSSSPTDLKKLTFSAWVKRASLSSAGQYHHMLSAGTAAGNYCALRFEASTNKLRCFLNNATVGNLTSDRVFRDVSNFYHVLVSMDTTLVTATDRCKIYINGELITLTGTSFTLNTNINFLGMSTNTTVGIGHTTGPTLPLDGYISEVYAIDGQALTPDDFAETDPRTGQWVAKEYEGTYGSNGFYLNSQNGASLGEDSSGNGNDFTNTGVTQSTDTPTDNHAILNSLYSANVFTYSLSEAGLRHTNIGITQSTIPLKGKMYIEYEIVAASAAPLFGLSDADGTRGGGGAGSVGTITYAPSGTIYEDGSILSSAPATFTIGDRMAVAFDADTGAIEFFKNNVSQYSGTIASTNEQFFFLFGSGAGDSARVYFTEASWTYAAPTGFKALSTKNLPEPVITMPTDYFAPIIYDDGAGAKTVGFQPDLVWMKARGATTNHKLVDSVRGVTKSIESNTTAIEATEATGLTSFDTNGFTVGADTDYSNTTGTGMVAWSWKEGITQGFDIVEYTPATGTQNHSLGVTPSMIIEKRTVGTTGNWIVSTSVIDGTYDYLKLNLTDAKADAAVAAPTSTLFTPQIGAGTTAIAYLFAEVEGFSKFGSYAGNVSTNGPFVYCGFRPAYVMIKSTAVGSWGVFDVRRNEYNTADLYNQLQGTAGDSSAATVDIDILSNGFKIRGTGFNGSAIEYVFMAFAESPFKYSRAR